MSVPITGTITAYAGGAFPTIDPLSGIDGWRSVADHATRNAIVTGTPLRYRQGMAVVTQNDGLIWIANTATPGGTDADWTQLVSGTGLTNPMTTAGDSIYGGSSGTPTRLAIGTAGQVWTVNSGATAPQWSTISGSGTVTSVSWTGDGVVFTASADTPVTTSGTLTPASLIAQTAHYVLAGPTSAGPTAPTFRALAAADLPTTGLTITQWTGGLITANPAAGTATFNLAAGNRFFCTLVNGTPTTLVLSSPAVGQQFSILLIQDGTGSCTVGTWFTGIKWAGGSAPTLTTTASKGDLVTFLCVSTGVYWGMIAGQNF